MCLSGGILLFSRTQTLPLEEDTARNSEDDLSTEFRDCNRLLIPLLMYIQWWST